MISIFNAVTKFLVNLPGAFSHFVDLTACCIIHGRDEGWMLPSNARVKARSNMPVSPPLGLLDIASFSAPQVIMELLKTST